MHMSVLFSKATVLFGGTVPPHYALFGRTVLGHYILIGEIVPPNTFPSLFIAAFITIKSKNISVGYYFLPYKHISYFFTVDLIS